MTTTLADLRSTLDELWPFAAQESWDASGLTAGDPAATVRRVLLCVDAVDATVSETIALGADVLLSHHPLLLRGVTSIAEDRYKGALLARLIRAGSAHIACHTNVDIVPDGVSDIIAQRLGLLDAVPLVSRPDGVTGLGRVGRLAEPLSLRAVAERAAEIFPVTAQGIRVAGDPEQRIERIALCGGAGDSLLDTARHSGADLYLTSDLRHHPASEFREQSLLGDGRPALMDVPHWAAESLWLEAGAQALSARLPGVEFLVSTRRTDPFDFVVGAERPAAH